MTMLYIITAFVVGAYCGASVTLRWVKSEFKKIDEECETE